MSGKDLSYYHINEDNISHCLLSRGPIWVWILLFITMSAIFLFMIYDELRTAGTIFIDIAPKDT